MKKIGYVLVVVVCVAFWGNICLAHELTDSESYPKPVAVGTESPLLAPYVAYGSVYTDGTIYWSRNVLSVTWNSTLNFWEIALNGVDFYYLYFTTLVSGWHKGYSYYYDSLSGNLVVKIYDSNGNLVKTGFSFRVER